jgi:peptidoglycan hydrolase CwlO-like protein
MANDSNPPININTNRRFVFTMGTAISIIMALYIVSANYFEMRADDRSLKESTSNLDQRMNKVEAAQSVITSKLGDIQADVRWLRELREQEIRRKTSSP